MSSALFRTCTPQPLREVASNAQNKNKYNSAQKHELHLHVSGRTLSAADASASASPATSLPPSSLFGVVLELPPALLGGDACMSGIKFQPRICRQGA